MNRREMLAGTMGGLTLAIFAKGAFGVPPRTNLKVAFMLGDNANVIDTMGPWEVFQDVMIPGPDHNHPFELMTVARTKELVTMTGGLQLMPTFSIADAPQPDIIVVPAQASHPEMIAWLRRASVKAEVVMSVCTGAFQLARAGLLKGIPATTHHDYWDSFATAFPDIELRRGLRFVDSGKIATAGGLTSGFDMALHVVQRYFGDAVAEATAAYMEHDSSGWRDGRRAAAGSVAPALQSAD